MNVSSLPRTPLDVFVPASTAVIPCPNPDTTMSTAQLGALGETLAAQWLEHDLGWRIVDRNWRCRYGELDLVAFTPHQTLVFVEVKTRRSIVTGLPQEAVTPSKQRHLRRAASLWFMEPAHRVAHNGVRFDVIAMILHDSAMHLTHITEAF